MFISSLCLKKYPKNAKMKKKNEQYNLLFQTMVVG
jgi:hypothetical protein